MTGAAGYGLVRLLDATPDGQDQRACPGAVAGRAAGVLVPAGGSERRRRGLVLVLGNSAVVDKLSADAEQSQVGANGCLAGECADVAG